MAALQMFLEAQARSSIQLANHIVCAGLPLITPGSPSFLHAPKEELETLSYLLLNADALYVLPQSIQSTFLLVTVPMKMLKTIGIQDRGHLLLSCT
jgi:hypothetical protein